MLKVVEEFLIKVDALFESDIKGKRLKYENLFVEMEEKFEKIRNKYGVNVVLCMRDVKEVRDELLNIPIGTVTWKFNEAIKKIGRAHV